MLEPLFMVFGQQPELQDYAVVLSAALALYVILWLCKKCETQLNETEHSFIQAKDTNTTTTGNATIQLNETETEHSFIQVKDTTTTRNASIQLNETGTEHSFIQVKGTTSTGNTTTQPNENEHSFILAKDTTTGNTTTQPNENEHSFIQAEDTTITTTGNTTSSKCMVNISEAKHLRERTSNGKKCHEFGKTITAGEDSRCVFNVPMIIVTPHLDDKQTEERETPLDDGTSTERKSISTAVEPENIPEKILATAAPFDEFLDEASITSEINQDVVSDVMRTTHAKENPQLVSAFTSEDGRTESEVDQTKEKINQISSLLSKTASAILNTLNESSPTCEMVEMNTRSSETQNLADTAQLEAIDFEKKFTKPGEAPDLTKYLGLARKEDALKDVTVSSGSSGAGALSDMQNSVSDPVQKYFTTIKPSGYSAALSVFGVAGTTFGMLEMTDNDERDLEISLTTPQLSETAASKPIETSPDVVTDTLFTVVENILEKPRLQIVDLGPVTVLKTPELSETATTTLNIDLPSVPNDTRCLVNVKAADTAETPIIKNADLAICTTDAETTKNSEAKIASSDHPRQTSENVIFTRCSTDAKDGKTEVPMLEVLNFEAFTAKDHKALVSPEDNSLSKQLLKDIADEANELNENALGIPMLEIPDFDMTSTKISSTHEEPREAAATTLNNLNEISLPGVNKSTESAENSLDIPMLAISDCDVTSIEVRETYESREDAATTLNKLKETLLTDMKHASDKDDAIIIESMEGMTLEMSDFAIRSEKNSDDGSRGFNVTGEPALNSFDQSMEKSETKTSETLPENAHLGQAPETADINSISANAKLPLLSEIVTSRLRDLYGNSWSDKEFAALVEVPMGKIPAAVSGFEIVNSDAFSENEAGQMSPLFTDAALHTLNVQDEHANCETKFSDSDKEGSDVLEINSCLHSTKNEVPPPLSKLAGVFLESLKESSQNVTCTSQVVENDSKASHVTNRTIGVEDTVPSSIKSETEDKVNARISLKNEADTFFVASSPRKTYSVEESDMSTIRNETITKAITSVVEIEETAHTQITESLPKPIRTRSAQENKTHSYPQTVTLENPHDSNIQTDMQASHRVQFASVNTDMGIQNVKLSENTMPQEELKCVKKDSPFPVWEKSSMYTLKLENIPIEFLYPCLPIGTGLKNASK